jgi:hypothetical protein
MAAEDIPKTAIVTPFGLFEYLFMPFGLSNAAQTFQRLMDKLFCHLSFVFTYLDDHLIASATLEEHLQHLEQFFSVLHNNGLTITPEKCVFAASSVKFLGHMVSAAGIQPLPQHLAAIQDFPPPTDVKQLQRFLGMINFYRRFLPGVAGTLQPLTDLLKGSPKSLAWSTAAAAAFEAAKIALANAHVAYALFQERFQSEKWIVLHKAGARVQRPLWASTGVKDPAYPDTLYVDQLIAAHTVNTMPPTTLDAVLDHSTISGDSISPQIANSKKHIHDLEETGISLASITTFLEEDGVKKFAQSWIDLLDSVKKEMK